MISLRRVRYIRFNVERVVAKSTSKKDEKIQQHIAALEKKFKGKGRVLIRPSGTEPLIRIMIEGEDIKTIEDEAVALAHLMQERLKK